jgi:predicted acylesterase/phospholipase RssA
VTDGDLEIEFDEPSAYPLLRDRLHQQGHLTALVCVQGGGAKGGWQGGVLNAMLGHGLVKPVAAMGTSAGAINAWLTSAKLANLREDPFNAFWGAIPRSRASLLRLLGPSLGRGIVPCASDALGLALGGRKCRRCAPLLGFAAFREVFSRLLEPLLPAAAIHTYLYATDTAVPNLPEVFDDQNLCTFMSAPGELDMEFATDGRRLDRVTAIATSACLPFIGPMRDGKASYADGGIYSNLPINILLSQGSMGGDCVICILATPLASMKPDAKYIDYRSSVLLHALREKQTPRKVVPGRAMVGPAIARTPVFLISPATDLRSGLIRGFFSRRAMDIDTQVGTEAGEAFSAAVRSFMNGSEDGLRAYNVSVHELRPLPPAPPALGPWVHWANPRWSTHWRTA